MVGRSLRVDFTLALAVALTTTFSEPVTSVGFDFAVYATTPGTSILVHTDIARTSAYTFMGRLRSPRYWSGADDHGHHLPQR